MQEWGHKAPFEGKDGIRYLGPYRNKGYWVPKARLFKNDNPPPECPMHVSEEQEPTEVQLELNFND